MIFVEKPAEYMCVCHFLQTHLHIQSWERSTLFRSSSKRLGSCWTVARPKSRLLFFSARRSAKTSSRFKYEGRGVPRGNRDHVRKEGVSEKTKGAGTPMVQHGLSLQAKVRRGELQIIIQLHGTTRNRTSWGKRSVRWTGPRMRTLTPPSIDSSKLPSTSPQKDCRGSRRHIGGDSVASRIRLTCGWWKVGMRRAWLASCERRIGQFSS